MSRIYESELVHLRKRKVSLRSMLDIIYPRIDKTFKGNQNLYDPIPMEILKRYPHPSLLLSHREDTIVKTVGHRTGHLKGYTERIVHKIYEKAKECYSGCDIDDIEVVKFAKLDRECAGTEEKMRFAIEGNDRDSTKMSLFRTYC